MTLNFAVSFFQFVDPNVGDLVGANLTTGMGMKLGTPIVANVIILGGLTGLNLLPITRDDIENEIKVSFPSDRVELNREALNMGIDSVKGK